MLWLLSLQMMIYYTVPQGMDTYYLNNLKKSLILDSKCGMNFCEILFSGQVAF